MKRYYWIPVSIVLAFGFIWGVFRVSAAAPSSLSGQPLAPASAAFTYQGRLDKDGLAINGICDIYISLWDSLAGGTFLNSNTFPSVPVISGLFTVQLDYGADAFTGEARWLETSVKCSGDVNYVTLIPRMPLTAAPYATYALNNWGLLGNSGAGSGNFLGTLDNNPLNLGVNGQVALRIQPSAQSPNIAAGFSGNYISPTIYGATIAGGGVYFYENRVMDTFGTVSGGRGNHADGYASVIGGGFENQATQDYAVVAGGLHNYATGNSSAIGGGFYNLASGYVSYIGGGDLNVASSQNATIGGGYSNTVSGGSLSANGTIGGGVFNKVTGFAGTIAGGHGNQATGEWSTLGGGGFNQATNRSTTVSGGEYNVAAGVGSTIGGGGWNGSSGGNQANGTSSTISGGFGNLISADGGYGVIGGGQQNQISAPPGTNLNIATIGGGYNNIVTLGGSTIAGGNSNSATAFDATVGGGSGNIASGGGSMVPGGISNLAQGSTSFAGGYRAKSYNTGCFTWADSNDFDFSCLTNNAFTVRATGGVFFVSGINGSGVAVSGVQLAAGGNSWSALSDRSSKTNVATVDGRQILEKLAQIPIATWNYKTQDASIRHIGPMAQDFFAAFGVGEDDKHINTVDADGVSLAAIQGLYEISLEKDVQIAQQQQQISDLQTQVDLLQRRLDGLDPAGISRGMALPFDLSTLFSLAAFAGVALLWFRGKRRPDGEVRISR